MADGSKTRKATVLPVATDGEHLHGLMFEEDGSVSAATFGKLQEGQPITGDYVQLTSREDSPLLDAEITEIATWNRSRRGPPKVNSEAYRRGWDRIFGNQEAGEA